MTQKWYLCDMKTAIKYYGGKYYMTGYLLANKPENYNRFVEVFGGSGSLLFAKEAEPNEIYNDLEKGVFSLYKCLSDTNLFQSLKDRLDLTYYHADIRKEAKEAQAYDVVDRAYYFFIKNRMSYNGVGGFSRNFVVRRGMSKSVSDFLSAIERLPEIHQRLSSVIIENEDWRIILKRYDDSETFMYLDPPYVQNTRLSSQKYAMEMSNEEHRELVEALIGLKAKIMLSGYENPIYDKLLENGFTKKVFDSPNSKSKAKEVIWVNYPCRRTDRLT